MRRGLFALLSAALLTLGVAGALNAQAPGAPGELDLPSGASLVGWFGADTTSTEILTAHPFITSIWWYNPATSRWVLDSATAPAFLRTTIPVSRGTGLFVITAYEGVLRVPLAAALSGCGLNWDPVDPSSPTIIVDTPTGGLVGSPVTIAGQAATFEANVRIRITGQFAGIVADTFTMAGEGFVLSPYSTSVSFSVGTLQAGCIEVFEESARDGSMTKIEQVPVTLVP